MGETGGEAMGETGGLALGGGGGNDGQKFVIRVLGDGPAKAMRQAEAAAQADKKVRERRSPPRP